MLLTAIAALALSQCATGVNDGPQSLCGYKTFEQAIVAKEGLLLDGPYAYVQSAGGRAVYARDSVAASSLAPSFYLQTYVKRTAGELLRISNADDPMFIIDAQANMLLLDGTITVTGHSGAPALRPGPKGYLNVSGRLQPGYWGHHGALTVSNEHPMIAGYLLQLNNGRTSNGGATNYVAQWNYLGGWETQAELRSYELPYCDGQDVNPNPDLPSNRYTGVIPDGGVDWYVATDAGHALDGCILPWIVDVRSPCQCDSQFFDGGRTSSWRKLHDRAECKP